LNQAIKPLDQGRRRCLVSAGGVGVLAMGGFLQACSKVTEPQSLTEVENRFWQQEFPTLTKGTLTTVAFRGKPLVLNFWATWCPPCIEELPLLNAFFNENRAKGWQVLGLAVDQLAPVTRFVAQNPFSYPVAMAGYAGTELGQSLGNISGGLPFTVVFAAAGHVLQRKLGRLTPDDLRAWATIPV
jgi:thiol-disulfide isomerase/thioredoxin